MYQILDYILYTVAYLLCTLYSILSTLYCTALNYNGKVLYKIMEEVIIKIRALFG